MRYTDTFEVGWALVKRSTGKAILCVGRPPCVIAGNDMWVPRSQLRCDLSRVGDYGLLVVTGWWANKSGLLDIDDVDDDRCDEHHEPPAPLRLVETEQTYRRLANEHHPDHGGNLRVMQAINLLIDAVHRDLRRANG